MAIDVFRKWGPFLGATLFAAAIFVHAFFIARIFSISIWYNLAHFLTTTSLFGLPFGAALVFMFPGYFTLARSKYHIALYAFWYALAALLSALSILCVPYIDSDRATAVDYYSLFLITLLTTIPYFFAGIVSTLLVVRFPTQTGGLYAALLFGAGFGGFSVWGIGMLLDAPTAVLAGATMAALSVFCFLTEGYSRFLPKIGALLAILLVIAVAGNGFLARQGNPFLRLRWVQGKIEEPALYETWSAATRIQVRGNPDSPEPPKGNALSPTFTPWLPIESLELSLDANPPGRLLENPVGGPKYEFLRFELGNLAYHVRTISEVLVLGSHDLYSAASALTFEAASLVVVEPNGDILDTLHSRYGELTGHLDQNPRVQYYTGSTASFFATDSRAFDLIQLPSPPRWNAHVMGALVHEAQLFLTVESWGALFQNLEEGGILSTTTPYQEGYPWEAYRTVSLAVAALRNQGVDHPADHLVLSAFEPTDGGSGSAVLLMSRKPFTQEELDRLDRTVRRFFFETPLKPGYAETPTLENLAAGRPIAEFDANIPARLDAPTANQPFFHALAKAEAWGESQAWPDGVRQYARRTPIAMAALTLLSLGLMFVLMLLPIAVREDRPAFKQTVPLIGLFLSLGLAFGWGASVLLYRLVPAGGSAAIGGLFILSMLFAAGGLGAYLTRRIDNPAYVGLALFLLVTSLLTLESFYLGPILENFSGLSAGMRWSGILGLVGLHGILLGPSVPLSLKVALVRQPSASTWLLGMAGGTTLLGLASAGSWGLWIGLNAVQWGGVGAYVSSLGFFIWACMTEGYSTVPPSGILHGRDQGAIVVVARAVDVEEEL